MMTTTDTADCAECAGLSRRGFLALGGLAAGAATLTTVFGDTVRNVAYAGEAAVPGTQNVVVVVSLRGAIDGLGVVVPHGEPSYYAKRPVIAIPKSKLLAADEMFGLHPALAPLTKYWNAGTFGAVHATGMARPNRSHFSAMEEIEDADPSSSARQGWVNRLIGLDATASPFEAINIGSATAPTLISGTQPTLATSSLSDLHLAGANPAYDDADWRARRRGSLTDVWAGVATGTSAALLRDGVTSALDVSTRLESFTAAGPQNGATYPTTWPATDLADALKDTATLIRSDLPVSAITLDYGSWDYHTNYGTLTSGLMGTYLGALAANLDAFLTDLGPDAARVTIVTISEFGRRIGENSAHGLDHGWGNVMLLLGAGIKGGRYHGSWPGLDGSASLLTDDDVAVTTDYRDVLSEVLARQFPERSTRDVFPGFVPNPIGVTR